MYILTLYYHNSCLKWGGNSTVERVKRLDFLSVFQAWDLKQLTFTVIDVSIVAYVLYKLLLILKGTRAVQLLKGVALLGAFSLISNRLGFSTVNWILNKAGLAILVAVPVIFQPELRRALEQLGRGRLFGRPFAFLLGAEEVSEAIDELVEAVEGFVRRRIGALIVIERETGLKDYIETGVAIDGKVTSEILLNIFFPNSPLHDGAVIINGDRVAAASCYLPLTDRPFLSKELGTRHRAALGITEESDAVAVIVSEETGIISLAFEGKITRRMDKKQLEQMLEDLLLPGETPTREYSLWPRR